MKKITITFDNEHDQLRNMVKILAMMIDRYELDETKHVHSVTIPDEEGNISIDLMSVSRMPTPVTPEKPVKTGPTDDEANTVFGYIPIKYKVMLRIHGIRPDIVISSGLDFFVADEITSGLRNKIRNSNISNMFYYMVPDGIRSA